MNSYETNWVTLRKNRNAFLIRTLYRELTSAQFPAQIVTKKHLLSRRLITVLQVPSDRIEEAEEILSCCIPSPAWKIPKRSFLLFALLGKWAKWVWLLALLLFLLTILYTLF